jgi:hypothetical protein
MNGVDEWSETTAKKRSINSIKSRMRVLLENLFPIHPATTAFNYVALRENH